MEGRLEIFVYAGKGEIFCPNDFEPFHHVTWVKDDTPGGYHMVACDLDSLPDSLPEFLRQRVVRLNARIYMPDDRPEVQCQLSGRTAEEAYEAMRFFLSCLVMF